MARQKTAKATYAHIEPVLLEYEELVRKWTRKIGLVGKGDIGRLRSRHTLDSLNLAPFMENSKLHLDVGSGGGFPVVPLALLLPTVQFTAIEKREVKAHFLDHVAMTLDISNLTVIKGDYKHTRLVGQTRFDTVTARAVSPVHKLWRWLEPYLGADGLFLAQTADCLTTPPKGAVIKSTERSQIGWICSLQRKAQS